MTKQSPETSPSFVDDYLPALLAQASQLISGEFHRIVIARGFTVSEWRVLATLAGGEPMSIGEIARVSVTKQPTVTRVLDRFEQRGDVRRVADTTDRRITLARITPSGTRLVSGLIALAREHESRVLQPFGVRRSAALKAALRQIIELHSGSAGVESVDEQD